jgi:multidrug resistance efflux pump
VKNFLSRLSLTRQHELDLDKERAALAQAKSRLATLERDNATLRGEVEQGQREASRLQAENRTLRNEIVDLKKQVAVTEADVNRRASLRALEITAGQGTAPIAGTPTDKPSSERADGDALARYNAQKNPERRAALWGAVKKQFNIRDPLPNIIIPPLPK